MLLAVALRRSLLILESASAVPFRRGIMGFREEMNDRRTIIDRVTDTESISWIRKMKIAVFYGRHLFVAYQNFKHITLCGSF